MIILYIFRIQKKRPRRETRQGLFAKFKKQNKKIIKLYKNRKKRTIYTAFPKAYFSIETASAIVFSSASLPYLSTSALSLVP